MVLADRAPDRMMETHVCLSPEATFELGAELGRRLRGGDAVLLHGGLGAGKTLFTKGMLSALDFDIDEVTSPSFTLVNLYRTDDVDVYHIDLWRIDEGSDAAFGVGLDEIVEQENAVVIIEWAERLGGYRFPSRVFEVSIEGSGEGPRRVTITERS
ncbi:MAG: tRNA (adenosine(37)-N6)-threonylcarbamoyltransferase complex ATPase subunit type 1 TsaE [Acidobacteria bacterium]|nr:tRNA (adenosine(37)-N6)-threonylcarbamoyltransferase complex ATPase subunit type 1 TsaE [Acidobacteriota bacterium]